MTNVTTCPECGSSTTHEWTENIWNSEIRHIRTCSECSVEYTVSYGNPVVEDIQKIE